jgi:hypothetical protein
MPLWMSLMPFAAAAGAASAEPVNRRPPTTAAASIPTNFMFSRPLVNLSTEQKTYKI